MPVRPFTNSERDFLEKIVENLPKEEGERVLADLAVARVVENGDFLEVELGGYVRPDYVGHRNLPVEGRLLDGNGEPVSILVNIDQNKRLLALEFIWWNSDSGTTLNWSTLEIVTATPMIL